MVAGQQSAHLEKISIITGRDTEIGLDEITKGVDMVTAVKSAPASASFVGSSPAVQPENELPGE